MRLIISIPSIPRGISFTNRMLSLMNQPYQINIPSQSFQFLDLLDLEEKLSIEKAKKNEAQEMKEAVAEWQPYFNKINEISAELGCALPYEFSCCVMKSLLSYPLYHPTVRQQYFDKSTVTQLADQKENFKHPHTKAIVSLHEFKGDSILQKQIIAYMRMFQTHSSLILSLPDELRDQFTQNTLLAMTHAYVATPTKEGMHVEQQLWCRFSFAQKKLMLRHEENLKQDAESSCLGDFIEESSLLSPLDAATSAGLAEATQKILDSLTLREQQVYNRNSL